MPTPEEQVRSIKTWHSWNEADPALPGYRRFWSADTTFSISVAFPRSMRYFFDFDKAPGLVIDGGEYFRILREDLRGSDDPDARALLHGHREVTWYIGQKLDTWKPAGRGRIVPVIDAESYTSGGSRVPVGESGFLAPYASSKSRSWTSQQGGQWVFFADGHQPVDWQVIWWNSPDYDQKKFLTVLRSWRWLTAMPST